MKLKTAKEILSLIEDQCPYASDLFVEKTVKRWAKEYTNWQIFKTKRGRFYLNCYVPQGDSGAGICDINGFDGDTDLEKLLMEDISSYLPGSDVAIKLAELLERVAKKIRARESLKTAIVNE